MQNRFVIASRIACLLIIVAWFWKEVLPLNFHNHFSFQSLVAAIGLYFFAHIIRVCRLCVLTLDERKSFFPIIKAHVLTAFPSFFFPFKLGELLRFFAISAALKFRKKSLAIWICERICDVSIITLVIAGLYFFHIEVPAAMRNLFVIFCLLAVCAALGLLAIAKLFIYLNRHLVLTSYSSRGLTLLKLGHEIRLLELEVQKSISGRLLILILLTVCIWTLEIMSAAIFFKKLSDTDHWAALFLYGLQASLPVGTSAITDIAIYQMLTVAIIAVTFEAVCALLARAKTRGT